MSKLDEIQARYENGKCGHCERDIPYLLAIARAAEKMAKALKGIASPEQHSPCRSGGIDEEGVCPNACVCEISTALAAYQEATRD